MPKEEIIFCRVSHLLKRKIASEALARDEAEAVIIREALNEYLDRKERDRGEIMLAGRGKFPRPKPGGLELNEPKK